MNQTERWLQQVNSKSAPRVMAAEEDSGVTLPMLLAVSSATLATKVRISHQRYFSNYIEYLINYIHSRALRNSDVVTYGLVLQ